MEKSFSHISYHIFVIFLSASIALALPFFVNSMAGSLLKAWAYIENEKIFLVSLEIFAAVLLILCFNSFKRDWADRKVVRMAKNAGLVLATPQKGIFARKRTRKLKKDLGFARELMIIGSTGYRSFVDHEGDLHDVLRNCREAKIMLLNPFKEGAINRAWSIPDPEITPEIMRVQIRKSIDYLKSLRATQRQVRLKLYPDSPLLKLAVVGDYAFLQHYHTGLDVRQMPEYAFKNEQKHGGLYVPLSRYFLSRWESPDIPEYDLDTDELVYRDRAGNEVYREDFTDITVSYDREQPDQEEADEDQQGKLPLDLTVKHHQKAPAVCSSC